MSSNESAERAEQISLRQLHVFETVGSFQNMRRASEHCGLSQPAVTYALLTLEKALGVQLLTRGSRGTHLNPAGEIFHARVKRFFAQVEAAIAELRPTASPAAMRAAVNRLTRSQIRALNAAIEHESLQRASELMGISKSALQKSVQALEANLHASLLYRTAMGVMVDPRGQRLGLQLRLAAKEIEWGIAELEAMDGNNRRQLTIGAMPFGGSVLLAEVLDEFLSVHPNADVRIHNGGAKEMSRSLRVGNVDMVIGLVPEIESAELVSEALAPTPYVIVGRRGHPLAGKGKVTLDDLGNYAWVIGTHGSGRRACFDALFDGRPSPETSIVTSALPVVRYLVQESDRLTLMTSYELSHESNALSAIRFGSLGAVPSIGITMRADCQPTQLHSDFIQLVRTHIALSTADAVRRVNLR